MSDEEARSALTASLVRLAREVAISGAESVGATLTVTVLEFAARELEQRAKLDGVWREDHAERYRKENAQVLEALRMRHQGVTPS